MTDQRLDRLDAACAKERGIALVCTCRTIDGGIERYRPTRDLVQSEELRVLMAKDGDVTLEYCEGGGVLCWFDKYDDEHGRTIWSRGKESSPEAHKDDDANLSTVRCFLLVTDHDPDAIAGDA